MKGVGANFTNTADRSKYLYSLLIPCAHNSTTSAVSVVYNSDSRYYLYHFIQRRFYETPNGLAQVWVVHCPLCVLNEDMINGLCTQDLDLLDHNNISDVVLS